MWPLATPDVSVVSKKPETSDSGRSSARCAKRRLAPREATRVKHIYAKRRSIRLNSQMSSNFIHLRASGNPACQHHPLIPSAQLDLHVYTSGEIELH